MPNATDSLAVLGIRSMDAKTTTSWRFILFVCAITAAIRLRGAVTAAINDHT